MPRVPPHDPLKPQTPRCGTSTRRALVGHRLGRRVRTGVRPFKLGLSGVSLLRIGEGPKKAGNSGHGTKLWEASIGFPWVVALRNVLDRVKSRRIDLHQFPLDNKEVSLLNRHLSILVCTVLVVTRNLYNHSVCSVFVFVSHNTERLFVVVWFQRRMHRCSSERGLHL